MLRKDDAEVVVVVSCIAEAATASTCAVLVVLFTARVTAGGCGSAELS